MTLSQIRISDLVLVVRLRMSKGNEAHISNRPENGLIFAEVGKLSFDHSGITYTTDMNTALIVPSGIDYVYHCDETGVFYVLNFITEKPIHAKTFNRFDVSNIRIDLMNNVKKCYYSWIYEKPAYIPLCIGLLYQILASIERLQNSYVPKAKQNLIENAFRYIIQHLNDSEINNASLAEKCRIGETYFRSLFTQMYQIPPMQYVKRRRIQEAQKLLSAGNVKVSEVAEAVGYASIYSFSKAFKMSTGFSPTEYIDYIRNQV